MADAAKHAENVFALTENADVVEHCTLVNVDACSLVVLRRESHCALAAVTAWMVDAVAVLTQRRDAAAFINVLTLVTISSESAVADAFEGSISVDARGVRVATSILPKALVHICARDPVSLETLAADALERTVRVDAVGELAAVILSVGAFIVVGALGVAILDRVSRLAVAGV